MDAAAMFVFCEPRPTFAMITLVGSTWRATPLIHAGICMQKSILYSLLRATPINPLMLQDTKSATLVVCQVILFYNARAADQ